MDSRKKTCTKCNEAKDKAEFSKGNDKKDGLRYWCRACRGKNFKEYYKNNKDKIASCNPDYHRKIRREYSRWYRENRPEKYREKWKKHQKTEKYRETHRRGEQARRARKKNLAYDLTAEQWQEILETYNHRCAYCESPWEHQDHVVPLAKGGGYTKDNIVPACKSCNSKKGAKDVDVFLQELHG